MRAGCYLYFKIMFIPLFLCWAGTAFAVQFFDKTPAETYQQTILLTDAVQQLRQQYHLQDTWSDALVHGTKYPRNEYQKALEVLTKINRYRVMHKLGEVTLPVFPSREITANEVFDLVQRLVDEVRALIKEQHSIHTPALARASRAGNYRQLSRISKALDPLLGVRGFTPNDLFIKSENILAQIRFLRITQNIPGMPKKPVKLQGKRSNHALETVYQLLGKINRAERNLWMAPVAVPTMEKRVITPSEVYDTLEIASAELQRIKFRLGVDRNIPDQPLQAGKTPDDIIQNIQWATAAMPAFSLQKELQQFNPVFLEKTPDETFALAQHVLQQLQHYKAIRGIRVQAPTAPAVKHLQTRHVYQETIECLKKVNVLQRKMGYGKSAVPHVPMRPITASDLYALISRLDAMLDSIYRTSHQPIKSVMEKHKTEADIFQLMRQISYEMDIILGSQGPTPDDLFRMVRYLQAQVHLIGTHLGYALKGALPPFKADLKPVDVLHKARIILQSMEAIKVRAGMFTATPPAISQNKQITISDAYNIVSLIEVEVTELVIHFGIPEQAAFPPPEHDKTPGHIYQQLALLESMLQELMSGSTIVNITYE